MNWIVLTTELFNEWFDQQDEATQEKVLATLTVLQTLGPNLGRPLVDTIHASQFPHMKELRIQHKGKPIRVLFAFDPLRQAIVLCIGNKGGNEKQFYKKMIPIADEQYALHLRTIGDSNHA